MIARTAAVAAALVAAVGSVSGQTPRVAVVPDTVTVGEVFRVAVQVDVPVGGVVRFADTLAVTGDIENAEPLRRFDEAAPDDGTRVTAVYRLSAWRPGRWTLPESEVRIEDGDGSVRSVTVPLPAVLVRSVLPADTAGVEPREAKSVLGGDRALWPWIVGGGLLAATVAAAAVLLVRRVRRRARRVGPPSGSPRERALAMLDGVRSAGLLDGPGAPVAVVRVAGALRDYLAETRPALGRELTTSELLARAPDASDGPSADVISRVLRAADGAKFASLRPEAAEARALWTAARGWIEADDGGAGGAGRGGVEDDIGVRAPTAAAPPEAGAA